MNLILHIGMIFQIQVNGECIYDGNDGDYYYS